jgi:LysR family transcriptional activator of mexEF-oprN operon
MNQAYGRDLDLNLLRVFVAVASVGSVTRAAAKLYLTQPAISAALGRLTRTVGAPLFARSGRGLSLTPRGAQLFARLAPLLRSIIDATLAPGAFDPGTSERTLRIGLSDSMEELLLAPLLRLLAREAPRMRLIALPVQFRTVPEALAARQVDMAVTVADELPASVLRKPLFHSSFVCLFDPRHVRLPRRFSERHYFAHEHVIVSYNGDLRGVVEDFLHKQRRVRCSVSSFGHVAEMVNDSALLATLPEVIARHIQRRYPELRTAPLPIALAGAPVELLWPQGVDDDDACRFVREHLVRIAQGLTTPGKRGAQQRRETLEGRRQRSAGTRTKRATGRSALKPAARARDR